MTTRRLRSGLIRILYMDPVKSTPDFSRYLFLIPKHLRQRLRTFKSDDKDIQTECPLSIY